jgi:hypothetical protein
MVREWFLVSEERGLLARSRFFVRPRDSLDGALRRISDPLDELRLTPTLRDCERLSPGIESSQEELRGRLKSSVYDQMAS